MPKPALCALPSKVSAMVYELLRLIKDERQCRSEHF